MISILKYICNHCGLGFEEDEEKAAVEAFRGVCPRCNVRNTEADRIEA